VLVAELSVVEVVTTEGEAELLCSLLRNEGIRCFQRLSDRGAGVGQGGYSSGPREIVVDGRDLASAKRLLAAQKGLR
jgi:Putative prokaryotic signal transducing protein